MRTPTRRTPWHTAGAVLCGTVAVSGFAGAVGLIGGGLSFGPEIDARLPFGSLLVAGLALLGFVAVPMTVAAVAAARPGPFTAVLVLAAGELLIAWIAVELTVIQTYSWLQPPYLVAAGAVVALAWLLARGGARDTALSPDPAHSTTAQTSAGADELGRL
jgi:hypothetical protein